MKVVKAKSRTSSSKGIDRWLNSHRVVRVLLHLCRVMLFECWSVFMSYNPLYASDAIFSTRLLPVNSLTAAAACFDCLAAAWQSGSLLRTATLLPWCLPLRE